MVSTSVGLPMFVNAQHLSGMELIILGLVHTLFMTPLIRIFLSVMLVLWFHFQRIISHPITLVFIGVLIAKLDNSNPCEWIAQLYQTYSNACLTLTRFVVLYSKSGC